MAIRAMGTVFRFTPSGGAAVTVGRLSSIGELKPDSEEIDVTALDSPSGTRAYIQGRREGSRLELKGFFDPDDAGQAALREAYGTGLAGLTEIVFPDGTAASVKAFVKSYSVGAAEVDGAVGFSAVLRPTEAIVITKGE